MELEDLVGEHLLTGVDESHKSIEKYGYMEDCNCLNFVLDGVTYTVTEDPSDGYRSSMRNIVVSDYKVSNNFFGCRVLARMTNNSHDEVLELIDMATGKTVLEVGTSNTDDYYPNFVSTFMPENMISNVGKSPQ